MGNCDAPTGKREAPAGNCDAPADKCEAPADKCEAPADKCEAPADKCEAPADKRGSPLGKRGSPFAQSCKTFAHWDVELCRFRIFSREARGDPQGAQRETFRLALCASAEPPSTGPAPPGNCTGRRGKVSRRAGNVSNACPTGRSVRKVSDFVDGH